MGKYCGIFLLNQFFGIHLKSFSQNVQNIPQEGVGLNRVKLIKLLDNVFACKNEQYN